MQEWLSEWSDQVSEWEERKFMNQESCQENAVMKSNMQKEADQCSKNGGIEEGEGKASANTVEDKTRKEVNAEATEDGDEEKGSESAKEKDDDNDVDTSDEVSSKGNNTVEREANDVEKGSNCMSDIVVKESVCAIGNSNDGGCYNEEGVVQVSSSRHVVDRRVQRVDDKVCTPGFMKSLNGLDCVRPNINLEVVLNGAQIKPMAIRPRLEPNSTHHDYVAQSVPLNVVEMGFVEIDAQGSAGGLICICNLEIFELIDCCSSRNFILLSGGDFNEIRFISERKGCLRKDMGVKDFNDFINRLELSDLPMQRRSFAWCNAMKGDRWSRIDRFLVDHVWLERFQLKQWGLSKCISYHCPVLLMEDERDGGPKHFWFINAWALHPKFKIEVKKSWEESQILEWASFRIMYKLRMLRSQLGKWNREVFGNIEDQLKKVEDELHKWDLKAEVRLEIVCKPMEEGAGVLVLI
ncbi:hypothetical protein ACSBR1_003298 [Camellia fascicularis]